MQNKTIFATIAILSSALFTATLTMSWTVQPAFAPHSGQFCSKKGACVGAHDAFTKSTAATSGTEMGNTGGTSTSAAASAYAPCGFSPGVLKNNIFTCNTGGGSGPGGTAP
jgi:hypothetical protein